GRGCGLAPGRGSERRRGPGGQPMTETEWGACADPGPMQRFLRDARGAARRKQGRRRLRLFACACARGVWHLLRQPGSRQGLYSAELYADGQTTTRELATAGRQAKAAVAAEYPNFEARSRVHGEAAQAARHAAAPRYDDGNHPSVAHAAIAASRAWALERGESFDGEHQRQRQAVHAGWLRDIFGNPFRPITLSPAWRTDTARALARQMYESRDFSALPILADALQDAGCDAAEVLGHCREPGEHARGCWAVDLVLGQE
ncbi:MAG TPA: hypothetical protein VGE74_30150, partial [Gemmata sp.]